MDVPDIQTKKNPSLLVVKCGDGGKYVATANTEPRSSGVCSPPIRIVEMIR